MSEERAADFARRFAEYWRAPTPDGLATVLADRVRLVAPMTPTTHTLAEGKRAFASLFELIAEMTAEVHRWSATEDGVLIDQIVLSPDTYLSTAPGTTKNDTTILPKTQ